MDNHGEKTEFKVQYGLILEEILMGWSTKKSFYVLLGVLGLLTLYITWGYLGLLFLALIVVIVFEPVYEYSLRKLKSPGWASMLSTAIAMLVVIIPLAVIISLASEQAVELVGAITSQLTTHDWQHNPVWQVVNTFIPGSVTQIEALLISQQSQVLTVVKSLATGLGQVVTRGLLPVVITGVKAIIDVIIFVMALGYIFPVKKKIFTKLALLTPLDPKRHNYFIHRFEVVVRATVKSTLLIGLAQAVLGTLIFWVLKIEAAALWGFAMGVAAFVPFGAGLVWWPIAIVLLLSGQYVAGVILILYGVLVIHTIDNIIRPKVLQTGETSMPELVTFVAVLGGIRVFGFLGFIMGPLIAALFLTALDFYLEDKGKSQKELGRLKV